MSLIPGSAPITIRRGKTFTRRFLCKTKAGALIDLTGKTARAQIRRNADSTEVMADLTTENGGITLGGAAGTIDILIDADVTRDMDAAMAIWDLDMISVGVTTVIETFLEGPVTITVGATQDV